MRAAHPHLRLVQEFAFHRFMGFQFGPAQDGKATVTITVLADHCNPVGAFHGGIVYAACDVTAYAAVLTLLDPSEAAVTHDIHVSIMRSARLGDTVRIEANVVKRGRSLVFVDAGVYVGGDLKATGRVTKSIVPAS